MKRGFGARMRSHRERRGIGLAAIARGTKIGVPMLEAIERDDVSRLPAGIFRRAFIRAYATAVGLDPEVTLVEFLEQFADPGDTDHSSAAVTPGGAFTEPLRLTLADEPGHQWMSALRTPGPRIGAAAGDLVMAIGSAAALFAIAGRFWTCLTVATIGYYFGGVLLVGTSPAAWVIGRWQRTRAADPQVKATEPPLDTGAEQDHVTPFNPRRYPKAV